MDYLTFIMLSFLIVHLHHSVINNINVMDYLTFIMLSFLSVHLHHSVMKHH